jgi:hypothetical protein
MTPSAVSNTIPRVVPIGHMEWMRWSLSHCKSSSVFTFFILHLADYLMIFSRKADEVFRLSAGDITKSISAKQGYSSPQKICLAPNPRK